MRATFLGLGCAGIVAFVGASSSGCDDATAEGEGEGEEGEGEGEGEGDTSDIVLDETQLLTPDTAVDPFATQIGAGLALAVRSDGRYAIAFATDGDGSTVTCETFDNVTPPPAPTSKLVVMDEQADGAVRTRVVDTVPPFFDDSIDIQVDPVSDALVIAYIGGDIAKGYCGASDMMVAVESGDTFTITSAATDSNSGAGPCRTLQNVCAQGDVVGRYPALALADDRSALAYLDLHFGFGADDIFGSDLEIGTSTSSEPTSPTIATACGDAAAGNYNGAAVTHDGKVVVVHGVIASNNLGPVDDTGYIPCPAVGAGVGILHKGIYAEYEKDDGTYQETQIIDGGVVSSHISVVDREGQGTFALFREDGTDQLVLARSVDDGVTWTTEFPEKLGITGLSPTMGFLSDGTQILAYGHCNDEANSNDQCDLTGDGTRITFRSAGETTFHKKTFTSDDEDRDGLKTDMAIAADDTIVVASYNVTQDQFVIQRFHKTP